MTKKSFLCILLLAVILLILFYKFFFLGKIFLPADILRKELPWKSHVSSDEIQNHYIADNIHVHYPWKVYLANQIKTGNFPLWCPSVGGGYPLFANPHYHYNFFLPFLLVFGIPTGYDFVLILELFLSGIFMFFLLREYQVGYFGSLISGVAYMLNFHFLDTLFHEQQVGVMMWLPLIFILFEKYKKSKKSSFLCLASLFIAFALFQGSLQSMLYAYLAIFLYFAIEMFGRKNLKQRLKPLSIFFGVGILSIILAAIALIPIFEFISLSQDQKIGFSLSKWLTELPRILLSLPFLIGFIFPDSLGSHQALDLSKFLGLGGNVNGNLFKCYVGLIPIFFVIFAISFKRDKLIRKYVFIGSIPILLIVFTPLYYFLYFRGYVITVFALSILAGLGADYFIQKEFDADKFKKLLKILIIILIITALFLIVGSGILFKYEDTLKTKGREFVKQKISSAAGLQYDIDWQLKKADKMIDHYKITNPSMYLPLLIMAIFLIIINLYIKNKLTSKALILIIFPIMIFDLFRFGWQLIPFVDKSEIFPKIKSVEFLKKDESNFRVASTWDGLKYPPVFHPNTLLPYDIDNIEVYESITLKNELKDDFKNAGYMNVKYLLLPPESYINAEGDFKEVYKDEVRILRNMNYLDRVRFKSEVIPFEDKKRMNVFLRNENFDLHNKSLILSQKEPLDTSFENPHLNSGKIVKTEPNKIIVDVNMKNDGFLEMANNYYHGWIAYVDGKKERTYLSNSIFMGIFIPKGKHSVVFSFKPLSFKVGMYISIISFLVLIGLILIENTGLLIGFVPKSYD